MAKSKRLIFELSKEYEFEGKKIKEIDYSKVDNFTAIDFTELTKTHRERAPEEASTPFLSTKTAGFALCVLQKATELPFEFFDMLSMKDYMRATDMVTAFLLS